MPNDCHYWKSFYVGQCLYNKYPHPLSVRLSSLSTLTSSDLSKNTLFFTMVHPLEAWNLIRSHQLFFFFFSVLLRQTQKSVGEGGEIVWVMRRESQPCCHSATFMSFFRTSFPDSVRSKIVWTSSSQLVLPVDFLPCRGDPWS